MIYSRSAEYAIRALVHMAQVPNGQYAMAKNIAAQEEIPRHFLAKILQQLARSGLLRSSKGPNGGFALKAPAAEVRLWDIGGSGRHVAVYGMRHRPVGVLRRKVVLHARWLDGSTHTDHRLFGAEYHRRFGQGVGAEAREPCQAAQAPA
jgi:Rrf2 family protein